MRKFFALLSLLEIASMALSACGGAQTPATGSTDEAPAATTAPMQEGDVREAILRVNTGAYPDTIDPQKSSFLNEIGHLKLVYVGLTSLNEKLETVPGGAS